MGDGPNRSGVRGKSARDTGGLRVLWRLRRAGSPRIARGERRPGTGGRMHRRRIAGDADGSRYSDVIVTSVALIEPVPGAALASGRGAGVRAAEPAEPGHRHGHLVPDVTSAAVAGDWAW